MAAPFADGIADQFVILPILRLRPDQFSVIETGGPELEYKPVEGDPGFGIHFRLVDRGRQLQMIAVRALEPLLDSQVGAVRYAVRG